MRSISDIGEFDLIARIERLAGTQSASQVRLGIGDDAALLRLGSGEELAVTTDALVEDVHFRWQSQSPSAIGRRALAVNLSDLAAMGARPLAFTLAVSAPAKLALQRFDGVIKGLLAAARQYDCPLVGGNLTRSRQLVLSVTALGALRRGRALTRAALRPGDRLFVTGSLGRAALALAKAEQLGGQIRAVPVARIEAGLALAREPGRGGCIDLSDGLLADLGHLLEASGVGAEISPERLPRPRGFDTACGRLGLDPLRLLLTGGEDYELLFSMRRGARSAELQGRLGQRLGLAVTEIGNVTAKPGIQGLPRSYSRSGWRHF